MRKKIVTYLYISVFVIGIVLVSSGLVYSVRYGALIQEESKLKVTIIEQQQKIIDNAKQVAINKAHLDENEKRFKKFDTIAAEIQQQINTQDFKLSQLEGKTKEELRQIHNREIETARLNEKARRQIKDILKKGVH